MARAKRTDRAAARRRHRAQLAADAGHDDALDDDPVEAEGTAGARPATTTRPARPATAAAGPERPRPAGGIRAAFRLAFRPANVREDLRLLPRLITHRSFWVPALVALGTTGVVIAFDGRELISKFALTYFIFPPPIGGIFLAGFLAPRASYLIGFLYGLISAVLLAVVVAAVPSLFPGFGFTEGLLSGLSTSPLSGILFGSAAAWYRRFLYLASPTRQAGRPAPNRGKPARGR